MYRGFPRREKDVRCEICEAKISPGIYISLLFTYPTWLINIQGGIPGRCHGPFDHKKTRIDPVRESTSKQISILGNILSFDNLNYPHV